jgi:hypothetical protein
LTGSGERSVNSENIISVNVANGVSIVIMATVGALAAIMLRKLAGKGGSGSGLAAGPGAASAT